MLRALIYLRVTSFRNWLLWRLRRLRQPKYLVGAIVGFAYLYFFFFRRLGSGRHPGMHRPMPGMNGEAIPTDWVPFAIVIGTVAVFVILLFGWLIPTGKAAALGFSEAEIAFLFPAPVTRRSLVHFRLLSSQVRTLVAGIVMALLSNRWSFAGGSAAIHLVGWWLVFSTFNLHFTGAQFTLSRLADRGLSVLARRLALIAAVAVVIGITLARVPSPERFPEIGATLRSYSDWALGLAATAPLSWLLFPLRLVVQPFFAPDWHAFALVIGPAMAVMVVHYFWVVQVVTSFEDASIAQAERRAAKVAAWRSGEGRGRRPVRGRAAPFDLSRTGRPELAFLWKNLLSTWPYFTVRALGIGVVVIVAASVWLNSRPALKPAAIGAAWMALFAAVYILVLGPQFARQDIRSDVRKLDVLKTYPLAGWQIVLGELLTPAAILTGFVWLALLTFVVNAEFGKAVAWFTPGMRIAGGISAALLVPPLVLLQLLVPNAAALIFPSWFEAARTRGGGPEVIGQRMIFLFAQLLAIIVVLLPATLVGGGIVGVALYFVVPLPVAVLSAVVPVIGILLAEAALALWWLGGRFDRLDVAEELRA